MENAENEKSYIGIFENQNLSEREKYKYFVNNNKEALALKQKVKNIVAEKGLTSMMNDTKWLKLQSGINKLPFPPAYTNKFIFEEKAFEDIKISDDPHWFGNWDPFYEEGMYLFFTIEYLKIKPRYAEHIGRHVSPKIHDETKELEELLKELQIPYETDNGTFVIYGYK
ncbi:DUF6678 family protein [Flavobacterium sp. GCM10023249]|uniref:DUF6678 family protein n=1 Tax=unclassified Flavobacterium TaxID=196869 RepID=UPI00360731C8